VLSERAGSLANSRSKHHEEGGVDTDAALSHALDRMAMK
jgi:hypothetical protein